MILNTIACVTPPFLPGATVGLSDGTRAIVTNVNADAPYFPPVRRLKDEETLDETTVRLQANAGPQIQSVSGVNIAQLLPGCEKPFPAPGEPVAA
jgi:hypothetical protein